MTTPSLAAAIAIGGLLSACADPRALDAPSGLAGQPFCRGGFSVAYVQIDPATLHRDGPRDLLVSAEGCGPRTLDLVVSSQVSVTSSYTGTYTPTDAQLSQALGYSTSASFTLQADSSVLVPLNAYARVAAYPTFQRATYQVVGSSCPGEIVVGSGTALKPVGVYFETCGVLGTDPCGVACVNGQPADAGVPVGAWAISDAGATDGG